jgi:hypothetical protein
MGGYSMPKRPYSPERHRESILKRKQTNPVDIRLKTLVQQAEKQGASKKIIYSLLESARRVKDNRFRAPRAKGPERKTLSFFEVKAKTGIYDFYEVPMWGYADKFIGVHTNAIKPGLVGYKHLVMRDKNKAARFTLCYDDVSKKRIVIHSIQRERTKPAYTRDYSGYAWHPELEKAESEKFRQELGMYPSEFLLAEFLFRNKDFILRGGEVIMDFMLFGGYGQQNYPPLLDRYFKPKKGLFNRGKYTLDLNKKRVREILGLQ